MAQFIDKTAKNIKIKIDGEVQDYELICMNEFSSERKLMSVLVRDLSDEKLYVFAKGAENQIMSRLSSESQASALKLEIDF